MMPSIANRQSIRERSPWVVSFAGAFYRWISTNPLPEFVIDFPNYVQWPFAGSLPFVHLTVRELRKSGGEPTLPATRSDER